MVRYVAWLMVFVLAGVLVGYFAGTLGDAGWLLIAAFVAVLWLAPRAYVVYRMPAVLDKRLRALDIDPTFSPPPGAEPAESDLLDRVHRAGAENDWKGFEALLADDFSMVDARGGRYPKRRYMAIEKTMARAYPDMTSTHEHLLADPFDPNVFWVLSHQLGHPRRGPTYDVSVWARYTVTPDHRLLREIASAAVIRVG